MYAHVTTYRLGSESETLDDLEYAADAGEVITDQSARTIASWWHSPADTCRNITRLSHGLPFDTAELVDEIAREITDATDARALLDWTHQLEAILAGAEVSA